jgi:hypothetical protein
MRYGKLLLAATALLPTGACASLNPFREAPQVTVLEKPAPVIPVECRLDPVAPEDVDRPALVDLPPAPAATDPVARMPYEITRRRNAELAGLYFQGLAAEEARARMTNAERQRACADWARRQP